jgi:porphobilinogen synthase
MTKSSSFPFNGLSANLELTHRPRRNRKSDWARRLVRENTVTVDDLIWPLFVREGSGVIEPIASMPGVSRLSVDEVVKAAQVAAEAGIPVIALFPYTNPALRNEQGSEALNGHNLVCQVCRAVKKAVPQIGILTDVALDPYTSHGHDGLLENGVILNDATVAVLVQQAVLQAEAGCDGGGHARQVCAGVGAAGDRRPDRGRARAAVGRIPGVLHPGLQCTEIFWLDG